jgi:hypothetical protein
MHKPTNCGFLTPSLLAFLGIRKGRRVQRLEFSHGVLQSGLSLQPKSREGRRKRRKRRGSSSPLRCIGREGRVVAGMMD